MTDTAPALSTRFLSTLALSTLCLSTLCRAPDALARPDVPIALWVWDTRHVTQPAARAQLLRFCRTERVSAIYLMAYQLTPGATQAYRAFNRAAHAQGMTVHALAGDPRWAISRYHHLPLAWVDVILAFNRGSRPAERFDGLHTDIEPYLLSRMWTEHPARLLGGLLDLHAKAAGVVQDHRPLQLGADVPFWFDDDPAYQIQWRDRVQAPSFHLLDILDYMTVMAYRNYADGTEGVIHLTRGELDYAEGVGKQVVIGQETQPDLFPAYITYGGTSPEYLWGELEKLMASCQARPSFGGIAFHHYESYRQLVQQARGGDRPSAS